MPEVKSNIRWDNVVASLQQQPWEPRSDFGADEDEQERTLYLGSCFSLVPSGKYYLPWACSNVEPCPHCKGSGEIASHKRRVMKKRQARARKMEELAQKRDRNYAMKHWPALRKLKNGTSHTCTHCGGLGSQEAYRDQLWWEKVEQEADERGLFITTGEGDPTDIFVGEVRDAPEQVEEEDELLEAT
jgi:hypothetical protein